MTAILAADTHLTNNPRDEYRWGLFPWLVQQAKSYKVSHIFILGDLVDAKDKHSAEFITRVRSSIELLTNNGLKVGYIVGNHDGLDENYPFFEFLELIPNVKVYKNPELDKEFYSGPIYCLPYIRDEKTAIETVLQGSLKGARYVFAHVTLIGSQTSTGPLKQGLDVGVFKQALGTNSSGIKIFAGDIHVPQKVGGVVEYVGSPYPIHLNDRFIGRCLLLGEDGETKDLHYPTIRKDTVVLDDKTSISIIDEFNAGDQIKIRVKLNRSEIADWDSYRKDLIELSKEKGIDLCGIELVISDKQEEKNKEKLTAKTHEDIFLEYCKRNKLSEEEINIGKKLL
jgi:DNA repair exonuclease SbcCD nuclease subunit